MLQLFVRFNNVYFLGLINESVCMFMTCDEGLIAAPDLALLVAVR